MKKFLLPLLISRIVCALEVSVVPDYYGYVDTMFPKGSLDPYGNLGVWGKIKYRLREYGYEIKGSSLEEFPRNEKEILSIMNTRSGTIEKIVLLNVPRFVGIDSLRFFPKSSLHLIVFEPPSVEPFLHSDEYLAHFSKVLTWDDRRIDGEKFVKFYYPVMYPMKSSLVPFTNRKLCTMIARNKKSEYEHEIYSERLKGIAFFEKHAHDRFDLYGYGWENLPLKTYRGSVEDKYHVLKKYKFSLCFENTKNIDGYITEKIFDCFHCGVVPVYLGASNVTDYIPSDCFIDMRDFQTYDDLLTFLDTMSEDAFESYLSSIRSFLATEEAHRFTDEYFVETFLKEIVGIEHTR